MDEWNEQLRSRKQTASEAPEIDKAYAVCFATSAGQKVLQHLRNLTIEQPTWYPGEDASHGFAREGQNSLVREIERRIKKVRTTDD